MNIIIAAMDPQGHIGLDGHLPWHDAQELSRFKELTMGYSILMGRKTWESISSPLKGRRIYVATHDASLLSYHVHHCQDATAMVQEYQDKEDVLMICGGRALYELALPYADQLYISIMKQTYYADTCFPYWDPSQFLCVEKIEYETFIWYAYQRKKDAICDL